MHWFKGVFLLIITNLLAFPLCRFSRRCEFRADADAASATPQLVR